MPDGPIDARWPKLLSLSVHEFRTPMTVVAGYIRMLLKDRAGPLSDQQRRLLEEAEKSCARLSALLAEVSDLSNLEAGTATYNREKVDVGAVLREAIEQLPPLPDREVRVDLTLEDASGAIQADPARLRSAFGSIVAALRRELVTSDELRVIGRRARHDGNAIEILIGDPDTLAAFESAPAGDLPLFDEWRGGCGLSLAVARRVLNAHGGTVAGAPGERKAGARILLPAG